MLRTRPLALGADTTISQSIALVVWRPWEPYNGCKLLLTAYSDASAFGTLEHEMGLGNVMGAWQQSYEVTAQQANWTPQKRISSFLKWPDCY